MENWVFFFCNFLHFSLQALRFNCSNFFIDGSRISMDGEIRGEFDVYLCVFNTFEYDISNDLNFLEDWDFVSRE